MKPTIEQYAAAVAELGILRFFPSDPTLQMGIIKLLDRMVGTVAQLNWLVAVMIDRVGEWHSPTQLRAVFCTRFKPADGVEGPTCAIEGFTPADSETVWLNEPEKRYLPAPEDTRGTDSERSMIEAAAKKMEF